MTTPILPDNPSRDRPGILRVLEPMDTADRITNEKRHLGRSMTLATETISTGRIYWYLLIIIVFLALLLRTIPLTYSHFWDETVYLQHAKVIVDGRTNYNEFDYRPPLLPLLYALGFAVWDNVYVANLVQGLVTTLAVLLIFLYARPLFGPTAALFAAFLLAFTPYFVNASHDLLTDMPAVTFMLLAMWLFDKPGTRFAFLCGVAFALAVQTRFTSLFLFVYFALDTVLSLREKFGRFVLLLAGGVAAITPYLMWVRWNYGDFLHPFSLARRITDEWTVPVPHAFYYSALPQIFPFSVALFFGLGVLFFGLHGASRLHAGLRGGLSTMGPDEYAGEKRQLVLLVWGLAFLGYMLSIPHKEVRYLLPLAIPVVVTSSVGLAETIRWLSRHTVPLKVGCLLLGLVVAGLGYSPPFKKLAEPWIEDRSAWRVAHIGLYLREISSPDDTVYAAHNFPVLAFYSERRTVSLLPIQATFEQEWRSLMDRPGFFVYFDPAGIGETHSPNPSFKPDRLFLETTSSFRFLRTFGYVTVYRYVPDQSTRQ